MHFNRQGTQRLHAGDTVATGRCQQFTDIQQKSAGHSYIIRYSFTDRHSRRQLYRQESADTFTDRCH